MTTPIITDELTRFLDELRRQEAAEVTLANYRSDLTSFARWFEQTNGEAFTAAAVTPTDVRDYKAHLSLVERRKPATVNRRLAGLKKFFAWAQGSRLIAESPAAGIKGLGAIQPSPKALEKREVDRLVRTVERHGSKCDLAVVQLLRHTGLRVSELCNLRLADVSLSERKGEVVVRSGKGNKWRTVPVNAEARAALQAYLAVRPATTDEHVFLNQRHQPVGHEAVEDLVKKYARLAGLEGVTPHTLRHTFGKRLVDEGVNLVTVAALMGHARLETTALYTQPSARDMEVAVDRLAEN